MNKIAIGAAAIILTMSGLLEPVIGKAAAVSSGEDTAHIKVVEMKTFNAGIAGQFRDVPAKHWAANAINAAVEKGYFKGYSDGTFRPNAPVTREEFAVLLDRVSKNELKDVSVVLPDTAGKWSQEGISNAVRKGFIEPDFYVNGFKPTQAITRLEMADWLVSGLGATNDDFRQAVLDCKDTVLPVAEYYKGGLKTGYYGTVAVAMGTGLFTGYVDGSFGGAKTTSRAEVAAILLRMEQVQGKNPKSFDDLNQMREVGKTGANTESFGYAYVSGGKTFKEVRNNTLSWYNGKIKVKVNHVILVDPLKKDALYTKMFIGKNFTKGSISSGTNIAAFTDAVITPEIKLATGGVSRLTPGEWGNVSGFVSGTEDTYGVHPQPPSGSGLKGTLNTGMDNQMWILKSLMRNNQSVDGIVSIQYTPGVYTSIGIKP